MTSRRMCAVFAVLAMFMFSREALAIPTYKGSVIAQCTGAMNVTASVTAAQWDVLGLTYTFVNSSGASFVQTGASGVSGGNNTVANFAVPPGSYTVTVRDSAGGFQASYQINAAVCTWGSLTIKKTVINNTGKPTPPGFTVKVTCGKGGPTTTVVLSNANGYMQTVAPIPVGRTCTIQELTPKAPLGCHWVTTYPQGTTVTIAGQMGYFKEVVNRLVCKGLPS